MLSRSATARNLILSCFTAQIHIIIIIIIIIIISLYYASLHISVGHNQYLGRKAFLMNHRNPDKKAIKLTASFLSKHPPDLQNIFQIYQLSQKVSTESSGDSAMIFL